MSWTLLTNDDGIDSPALEPFATALAAIGPVIVCVPDRERSWVGKSISRFDPVDVLRREPGLAGADQTWTCSGTPADAAQVGMHCLGGDPPSLVVSGINVGANVGTAFLLSSGTVGAAFEGWIAGVPAVAFSTRSTTVSWGDWVRNAASPEAVEGWSRVAGVCVEILRDIVAQRVHAHADIVTVNLPWESTADTRRRVTSLARVGYGPLFGPGDVPEQRRFAFRGVLEPKRPLSGDADPGTQALTNDIETLDRGEVSITPLLAPQAAQLPVGMLSALQAGRD